MAQADQNQQANPGGLTNGTPNMGPMRPRRPSITERFIGHGREWFNQFYKEEDKDEVMFGNGFNDPTDDFLPGVICSERRRRTMSMSSEGSVESFDGIHRPRSGSLTERIVGMQLIKPENKVESIASTIATVVDDQ